MNWTQIGAFAGPVFTLVGVIVAPELGRRAGRHGAEAALKQAEAAQESARAAQIEAEAAKDEAAAEMRKAVAAEREAASADWARFVDAKDREIARLSDAVAKNGQEILQAQMSIQAAEERARNWEQLFRKAKIYMQVLILFIKENVTGVDYPDPPAELELDL